MRHDAYDQVTVLFHLLVAYQFSLWNVKSCFSIFEWKYIHCLHCPWCECFTHVMLTNTHCWHLVFFKLPEMSVLRCLSPSLLTSFSPKAALQVGGHGERLHQCREVTLLTYKSIPMQVDGEPCRLAPSLIRISLRNQANMVQKSKRRTSMPLLNEWVGCMHILMPGGLSEAAYSVMEFACIELAVH